MGPCGTRVSGVCSPSQFPGSKGTSTGPVLAGDKARDTSSGLHSHPHLGCTCCGEKSRSQASARSDPCQVIRMFMSRKVTAEHEVTPSHLPACLLDPLPACFLCPPTPVPVESSGLGAEHLTAPTSCFPGRPLEFREGRVLSLGETARHCHSGRAFCCPRLGRPGEGSPQAAPRGGEHTRAEGMERPEG